MSSLFENLDRFFSGEFANEVVSIIHESQGFSSQKQEDGSLSFSTDVPGIDAEDLKVELTSRIVLVSGERKNQNSSYKIEKSFVIPQGFDTESLKSELSNGVLTFNVAAHPDEFAHRKIEVKSIK